MKAEQLRKSILQMAIQGKLVPQDPKDEPASVLLEKIRAEKQKLVKEGKIKKDKCDSVIFKGDDNCYYEKIGNEVKNIDKEIPFDIPDSWAWCRFPNIVNFILGKTPDRHNERNWTLPIIPWFSIADMKDKKEINQSKEKISKFAYEDKFNHTISPTGTLLMSFKLTVGRTSILGVNAVHNEAIISILPYIDFKNVTRDYLLNILGLLVEYVPKTDAIKGKTLNSDKIKKMLIPLPPIAEQERIVKKIKQYEPLLVRYDKLETEATVLDDTIKDKLKKSILQYAIQGKLVPQDKNDEPASLLLERIRTEKKALLGKKYVDSYIYKGDDNCYYEKIGNAIKNITEEIPFEVPDKWEWIRLKYLVDFSKSNSVTSARIMPDDWILDLEDIEKDTGTLLAKKRMKDIQSKSDKHIFYAGNILYSKLRPYLNKVIIADERGYCTTEILSFDFGQLNNQFAQIYLMSPWFVDYAMQCAYGVKMPRIGSERGNNALMPIPPVQEQRRIVDTICKLKEMMGYCPSFSMPSNILCI